MEKYFRIPISRREFVKVTGSATGDRACIAAAWGVKNHVPVSAVCWEELPATMRSYISEG